MVFNVVSFEIEERIAPFEGHSGNSLGDVRWVQVVPVVDGIRVVLPGMFDAPLAWCIPLKGTHEESLFTCACGVSECAGYMHSVHVVCSSDTVQWKFPQEKPYTHHLASHFPHADKMHWTFDALQYQRALAGVRQSILDLEASRPDCPVVLDDGGYEDALPPPIAEWLDRVELRLRTYFRRKERDIQLYGPWWESDVHVATERVEFSIRMRHVLDVAATIALAQMDAVADTLEQQTREDWLAQSSRVLRLETVPLLVQSIPFDMLESYGWLSPVEQRDAMANAWPHARIRVTP